MLGFALAPLLLAPSVLAFLLLALALSLALLLLLIPPRLPLFVLAAIVGGGSPVYSFGV